MPRKPTPLLERFAAKVATEGDCAVWTGCLNSAGYGMIGLGGRGAGNEYAHRLAYMWAHGLDELPAGHHVDHLCRNRRCVKPAHLELVTHGENIRRGMQHHRQHMTGRYSSRRYRETSPGIRHVKVSRLADETTEEGGETDAA